MSLEYGEALGWEVIQEGWVVVRAERIELSRPRATAPSRLRVYQFHHARVSILCKTTFSDMKIIVSSKKLQIGTWSGIRNIDFDLLFGLNVNLNENLLFYALTLK